MAGFFITSFEADRPGKDEPVSLSSRFSGPIIVLGRTPLILVCLVHAFFDQLQPDIDILIGRRSVDMRSGKELGQNGRRTKFAKA
jgi:hypothetical protein